MEREAKKSSDHQIHHLASSGRCKTEVENVANSIGTSKFQNFQYRHSTEFSSENGGGREKLYGPVQIVTKKKTQQFQRLYHYP